MRRGSLPWRAESAGLAIGRHLLVGLLLVSLLASTVAHVLHSHRFAVQGLAPVSVATDDDHRHLAATLASARAEFPNDHSRVPGAPGNREFPPCTVCGALGGFVPLFPLVALAWAAPWFTSRSCDLREDDHTGLIPVRYALPLARDPPDYA